MYFFFKCEEKRKKLRKELAQKRAQKPSSDTSGESIAEKVKIDEDDPDKVSKTKYKQSICSHFTLFHLIFFN